MRSLRCACIVASAAPLIIVSCADLKGLSNTPDAAAPPPCAQGLKPCAGTCVAIDDPAFGCGDATCERCSVPFARDLKCGEGKCLVATCVAGRADCNARGDDGCESRLGSAETCGTCGAACGPDRPFCNPLGLCVADCGSYTLCGTSCVDLAASDVNCGICGKICGDAPNAVGKCIDSQCAIQCNAGFDDCDHDPDNGCEPLQPYFKDGDGDGFGAGPIVGQACAPPAGNSALATDCADNNDKVHPGQTTYFGFGYTNASGETSYDYDCNGKENTDPALTLTFCGTTCQVGGYGIAPPRTKAPANSDSHCGSTKTISSCSGSCSFSSGAAVGCR